MIPTVFWILVALSQGQGLIQGTYGNREDCISDLQTALGDPNVLLISGCVEITLKPKA